ncbi:hypothetical protein TSUD_153780 [Trifolium subterraneum]|uniref:Uncharacterized protein n=1 Tax=Trifolium subterraneum TaxID=3900 RepID=A0A2Z6MVN0_TRISU|nr:hypothetical protein TSUD_153780 [Trifolium subterraneum]
MPCFCKSQVRLSFHRLMAARKIKNSNSNMVSSMNNPSKDKDKTRKYLWTYLYAFNIPNTVFTINIVCHLDRRLCI